MLQELDVPLRAPEGQTVQFSEKTLNQSRETPDGFCTSPLRCVIVSAGKERKKKEHGNIPSL